jgi:DNA-binding CsgD family transcriptional regulator
MPTSCDLPDVKMFPMLTCREKQIAALVCEGLSNKLIARRLAVSEGTIKSHLHTIFSKLGLDSRFALIKALVGGASTVSRSFDANMLDAGHSSMPRISRHVTPHRRQP